MGAWLNHFYQDTLFVCPPSKKSCQCRVHQDFAYVGNVETYPSAKTLAGIVPQKTDPHKNMISSIFVKNTLQQKMLSAMTPASMCLS